MSKERSRNPFSKARQNIAVGILALIVIFLGIYTFRQQQPPVAASSPASVASPSPTKTAAPEKAFAPWGESVAGLSDTSKPWTLAILGDSTGNDGDEWVFLMAAWISTEHDRPVDIQRWDTEVHDYTSKVQVGGGSGEPVVIWNHSAPGQSAAYTLEHLKAATPEQPDAVIVNHGHNGADAARIQVIRLVNATRARWDAPPALAVTLQNPHTAEATKRQRANLSVALEQNYKGSPAQLIDVRSAFESAGNVALLLSNDGLHPNSEGSKVWAEAVISNLR